MTKKLKEGWAVITGAAKFHYIGEDGRALCGRWFFLGVLQANDQTPNAGQSRDCSACVKKLAARTK